MKVLAKSLLHRGVESPEDSGGSTTVTLHTRHLGLALKLSKKSFEKKWDIVAKLPQALMLIAQKNSKNPTDVALNNALSARNILG